MSEVVSAIGKGDGAQLYLVDRKGVLIARSNGGQAELRREDRTVLPIAPGALAGKAVATEFADPRTGESVLGSHVPIARLGWAVVATKPKAMAFAPADRLARWLVGVSAACAALAVVLGWRLARALTRPIARTRHGHGPSGGWGFRRPAEPGGPGRGRLVDRVVQPCAPGALAKSVGRAGYRVHQTGMPRPLHLFNERHLRRLLRAYLVYYGRTRPHQALGNNSPRPREVEPPARGRIVALPEVDGLHHRYARAGGALGQAAF
jgi:hypothetical protein